VLSARLAGEPPLPPARAALYPDWPLTWVSHSLIRIPGMREAKDWPLDAFIEAAAAALALPVEPAWRPQIRAHLQVTWRFGQEVAEFDLPDELEPAPVFET
jgi:Protein of unknown function (DUF4089)